MRYFLSKRSTIKHFILLLVFIPLLVLFYKLFTAPQKVYAATTTVDLLTADNFAVLAGSSVNDTNISVISGDVGLSPSTWSSALTCAEVTGTIYSVDASGPLPCRVTNPGLLTQAQNDLTTAYTDASNRTPATTLAGGDNQLGSQVLTDGIYTFGGASSANLSGTLTLDGQGDPDAVFIFQASSTLVTASSSVVSLINGAQACNVFWQVSTSATLGTGSNFVGTIMADQSITDNGGSTVNGRFLARIAAVTLNDTDITKPTCTSTSSSSSTSTSSSSSLSSSGASVCVSQGVTTIPSIISSSRVSPTSVSVSWGPNAGLDDFVVQYGFQNGDWQFSTNVSGFSTTINNLPANQAIWVRVAATDNCDVGTFSAPVLVGGTGLSNPLIPRLPNTGTGPDVKNILWTIVIGVLTSSFIFFLTRRLYKFSSK